MKVSKGKKVRTIILIVVFALFICLLLVGCRFYTEIFRIALEGNLQVDQAMESMEKLAEQLSQEQDALQNQIFAKLEITARALRDEDFTGWDGKVCAFGNGYIAQMDGDIAVLPKDIPYIAASEMDRKDYPEINQEQWEELKADNMYYDPRDNRAYITTGAKINDDYSYVEFVSAEDQAAYANRASEVLKDIQALEDAFGVKIILQEDSSGDTLYAPEDLSEYDANLEALGIQTENGTGDITLQNDTYSYIAQQVGEAYTVIVLTSTFESLRKIFPLVLPICGIILVCLFVYAFWVFSVFKFVRTERLSLNRQKTYAPKRVRSVSFAFGIISAVLIFAAALYGSMLIGLYQANISCNITMKTLFEKIEDNEGQLDGFKKIYDNNIIEELRLTADLMEAHPELMKQDFVEDVSSIIGADYLVLYGTDGKEYMTNSGLRELSLGGAGDSSGAFLKLQNGISSVISEPDPEDPAGINMVSYGVPLSFEEDKAYGVLAAYISPKVRDSLKIFTQNELIDLLAPGSGMIFTVDPETKNVIYSNVPEIIGRNIEDLGMDEKYVKDQFLGYFRLGGVSFFGISQSRDNVLFYTAVIQDVIMFGSLPFALVAAVPYLLLFLVLMLSLLRKYKEPNIEWQDAGEEYDDSGETVVLPTGEEKRTVDVSQRWKLMRRFLNKKNPGTSAKLLAEILALVCIAGGVIYFLAEGKQNMTQQSILGYVMYGDWTKGFNIFALTAILLIFALVFFLNFVLELIGYLLHKFLNTKGETIARLCLGLARYALIIMFVYYASEDLGFDTRAVIASLGVLSFALSLGMKDLVTDVIAGLTIVLEGEYQVGDIVEIGGFRGSVVEVGVRSTKLMGSGGNIKIISNRDVKNVLNMTHLNSWCSVEVTISREESMDRMEQLLEQELPQIGQKITGIISGPYYKGVLSFGQKGRTISITAECKEKDFHRVQRQLTGELNRIFDEGQVKY